MVAAPSSPLLQPFGTPALKKTSKSLLEPPYSTSSTSTLISVALTDIVFYYTPPIIMSTVSVVSESMSDPVIVISYLRSDVNSFEYKPIVGRDSGSRNVNIGSRPSA